MVEDKHPEEAGKKWITVMGKRIQVDQDDSVEDIMSGLPKDLRGEKERNSKEARKSVIVQRFNLEKSKFNFRDEVIYDNLQKSGTVGGFDGNYIKIFTKGTPVVRPMNDVFKKSEFIGNTHWDIETIDNRRDILMKSNISQNYVKYDWARIPAIIQDKIQKDGTPAGTGISTSSSGVWNPVNTDRSVDDRLKELEDKKNEKKQRD